MLKLEVKKCNLVESTAALKYELFGTTQREGLTNSDYPNTNFLLVITYI